MSLRDPYQTLHEQLLRAARAQETPAVRPAPARLRAWLAARLHAWMLALAVLLSGGAVALAASGILSGSPVSPQRPPNPRAGNGLPVKGSTLSPVITVADPAGGLPWAARVFDTTRGQTCIQVGRLKAGQIGLLGLDSAFHDDGRFHALRSDTVPPGYGGPESNGGCVASGQTALVEAGRADRSADRLLPEEFASPPAPRNTIPPIGDLRALAYGMLGPHAISVTYRTPSGLRTIPVTGPHGAFLIVEAAGRIGIPTLVGRSVSGNADTDSVSVLGPAGPTARPVVAAASFRFAGKSCSEGTGAPVGTPCPERRSTAPARGAYEPARSLHRPVKLTLLQQSPATCRREFLLIPCYSGRVAFTAPYQVTTASAEYAVFDEVQCKIGGRPEGGWSIDRDVAKGEHVRTISTGLFVFAPSCAPHETFRVVYLNPDGPSRSAPHASVIVGSVGMRSARLPGGELPVAPRSR